MEPKIKYIVLYCILVNINSRPIIAVMIITSIRTVFFAESFKISKQRHTIIGRLILQRLAIFNITSLLLPTHYMCTASVIVNSLHYKRLHEALSIWLSSLRACRMKTERIDERNTRTHKPIRLRNGILMSSLVLVTLHFKDFCIR